MRAVFSKHGDIKSIFITKSKNKKDGIEKPYAFVCFDKEGQQGYGFACAENAIKDIHDQVIEGFKFYAQPALPAPYRYAQLLRDQ